MHTPNNSNLHYAYPLSPADKQFLRENIFKALDVAPNKIIQSAFCSVIYNIAQVDFPEGWKNSVQEVGDRIKVSVSNEAILISGLMALKEIFEANEYHLEEDRTTLNQLVEMFFPLLEQVMQDAGQSQSGNQILVMHLISKIFYSANNLRLLIS